MMNPHPTADANPREPITCEMYESRRLGIGPKRWRFRFRAANGKLLGHEYNDLEDCYQAVRLIGSNEVPCKLVSITADGSRINHVRLR